MMKKKQSLIYIILIAVACVSMVFTNVSYDAEYQLAMAYRVIKGDAMITQMWEPHQTSAFLCAIFMKLYMTITGTTTGIVLYTQIVGLLIRAGIAILMYKTVKEVSGEKPALLAGVLYLLISPKELLTPEFGNMQLWFGTLLFLSLLRYFKRGRISSLIFSAIWLCLGVFSYPSFIIVYIAAAVLLWKFSGTFKRDILIFTGVCALIGGSFAAYLLWSISLETILVCLENALAVEPSHTVSMSGKLLAHVLNLLKILGMLAGTVLIGLAVEGVYCIFRSKKTEKGYEAEKDRRFSWERSLLFSWFMLMIFLLLNILSVKNRGGYAFPFVAILLWGFMNRKLLTDAEGKIYESALWISGWSLIATLVLSDNAFLQAVTYMLIAICISIIPIYRWWEGLSAAGYLKKCYAYGMHVLLVLVIFRCCYIHIPFYGRSQIYSILSDIALVRSGPAIGIIAEEEGVARQRDSMREWKEYVQPGDIIWIIGEPVDTLGYLYEDVEVGAPTVMSTPTYTEALEYYWTLNPDKFPNVVILSSGFGELSWELQNNSWLLNWLDREFCADTIVDGNYWRYYIKR